ncbi:hypothetical protein V6N12_057786 [Hibiscus sabdariffa]|uniref:Uncharacterized protein n=1 Tax=Hibiscus sabdariffa TaxID=183260 RepID=A0ABR1ZCW2_9ROSI
MCQGLEGSAPTTAAFTRQYTFASLTKNKQGIQPAFASLCKAFLPSLTRCSPLKLGLGSLSFFHLGKMLRMLDFTVRLLLSSYKQSKKTLFNRRHSTVLGFLYAGLGYSFFFLAFLKDQ